MCRVHNNPVESRYDEKADYVVHSDGCVGVKVCHESCSTILKKEKGEITQDWEIEKCCTAGSGLTAGICNILEDMEFCILANYTNSGYLSSVG